ncbi:MAG: hypothetical protein V4479_13570 [Actinomycetota bacterium]
MLIALKAAPPLVGNRHLDDTGRTYHFGRPTSIAAAGTDVSGATMSVAADHLVQRIRIDAIQTTGTASLKLQWVAGGAAETVIPGADLKPDYGLVTSTTTTDDTAPANAAAATLVSSMSSTTSYGAYPWLGLATLTTSAGLTTSATYETPGTGWLRQLSTTLPAGSGTAAPNSYYGDTATIGTTVCGLPASTIEYGIEPDRPTPAVIRDRAQ